MPKILILADDLTGANDTGAAIHDLGFETYTVVNAQNSTDTLKDYACISVNLESRGMESREAAETVHRAAKRYTTLDTALYAKRIDSTLRGNLGSECDALLDQLPPGTVAAVNPAFPKAGRIYRDEKVLVNGRLLEESAAANDPKWPMRTSSLQEVLLQQTTLPISHIPLSVIRQGREAICRKAEDAIAGGARYLLFESETDEDIQLAAEGIVATGHPFIAVDPGPFTAAAARCLVPVQAATEILAVVGSVNAVTQEQVRYLIAQKQVLCTQLDISRLLQDDKTRTAEIERATTEMTSQEPQGGVRLLLLSSVLGSQPVPFGDYARQHQMTEEMVSRQINDDLSHTACQIIKRCERIGGLFTCGGDVTVSMCNALGADGMRVLNEVIPLAVCGELTANNGKKYLIVTKGGMVGERQGIIQCLDHLSEKLYTKERF